MNPVAILVLADTQTHADLGRVVNATRWVGEFSDTGHRAHPLFEDVKDVVSGACGFCARSFEAADGVNSAEVTMLEEYHDHPSVRKLLASGYQMITF